MSSQQQQTGGGQYHGTGDKADLSNHSNQCNPNNQAHAGHQPGYTGTATRSDLNNHSNQMNPNNSRFQGSKK